MKNRIILKSRSFLRYQLLFLNNYIKLLLQYTFLKYLSYTASSLRHGRIGMDTPYVLLQDFSMEIDVLKVYARRAYPVTTYRIPTHTIRQLCALN